MTSPFPLVKLDCFINYNTPDGNELVKLVYHLPAFPDPQDRQAAYRNKSNWEERYTISASDIKLAVEREVAVVTTAASGSAENFEKPNPLPVMNEKRFRKITIQNLRHLKDAGVRLAVGSDTMPGAGNRPISSWPTIRPENLPGTSVQHVMQ